MSRLAPTPERLANALATIQRLEARERDQRRRQISACTCDAVRGSDDCACVAERLRCGSANTWQSPRARDLWRRQIRLLELREREPLDATKLSYATELLERGYVEVTLDARKRRSGARVPKRLRGDDRCCLIFGRDLPIPIPDLVVDATGIGGTLSFRGRPYSCFIPWSAIYRIDGEHGGGTYWAESFPADWRMRQLDLAPAPEAETETVDAVVDRPRTRGAEYLACVLNAAAYAREAQRNEALAQLDADEQFAAALPPPRPVEPGDVFRLTGRALRSMYGTRAYADGPAECVAAPDDRWVAVACACELCESGRLVAAESGRHFARAGIERCPFAAGRSEPTSAGERDAFLAYEREHLGIERVTGTLTRWGDL